MRTVAAIIVLLVAATSAQSTSNEQADQILGRPDGHEAPNHMLGRPDGHEPFQQSPPATGAPSPPIIGRPDGHDEGAAAAVKPNNQDAENEAVDDYEDSDSNLNNDDDDEDEDDRDTEHDDVDDTGDDAHAPDNSYEGYESLGDYGHEDEFAYPDVEGPLAGDDELPEEVPDEEKPLVRCKRPICTMVCENGFETDSVGCMVCQCLGETVIGRPDGHEPSSCANRPMCRMFCEHGFKTDESGCPVCSCLDDPCESVNCEDGAVCERQPCGDQQPCSRLSAKCIARLPCPEPMCANFCPGGYKKNTEGCMTCNCAEVPAERMCGEKVCENGQICRNLTAAGSTEPQRTCTVKTLCELMRDKQQVPGAVRPTCELDGSFMPMQCNKPAADCWCIDGSGREVDQTRTAVYIEEHKPKCVRNITVSMHIHMTLVVRHDIDIGDQLSLLNSTIIDHVSSWLLIQPHYIRIVKAEMSDDNDDEDEDEDDSKDESDDEEEADDDETDDMSKLVFVELVVVHDGVSDLPSAAEYMKRRMYPGCCQIQIGTNVLEPDIDSVKTVHQYAYKPVPLMHDDLRAYGLSSRKMMHYALCASAGLVLLVIATIFMVVAHHHRRSISVQFQHQKLAAQDSISSEKNLLATECSPVVGVTGDEKHEEKYPIA